MPRPALLVLLALVATARPAAAQAIVWTDAPLSDALYALADRTGLDLVFAARVVRDRRVSGRYSPGESPVAALDRLLRGTGLRAEPLRPGQFVLIAEPLNVTYGGDEQPEAVLGTLDGRVVDAETGEPLPGASVFVVDVSIRAVTDDDGAFAVGRMPAGRYGVRVTFVGYRAVRVDLDVYPLSPRRPPVVRLSPEPLAASEVKIDADEAGTAPGVTDMRARGVAATASPFGRGDLGSALATLPGLSRTDGAGGPVAVRGTDPDALRVLRDGVPLYAPWHAGGLLSVLQPEALGRIVLHRGQAPAALAGGLAAVLETETASAFAGDTVSAVAASAVAVRGVATVAVSPRVSVHVGALRSVLGPVVRPGVRAAGGTGGGVWAVDPLGGRRGDLLRPHLSFESAEAAVGVRVGRSARLDVAAWGTRDRLTIGDAAALSGDAWAATAALRGLVGSRTFATARLYTTRVAEAGARASALYASALRESAAALDVERALTLAHTLSAGGRAVARQADGDRRASQVDVYAADTWSPVRPWQVQAGLRAEAASAPGRAARVVLSPRVAVRWIPVADRVVVRAGLSRQTQAVQRVVAMAGPFPLAEASWAVAGAPVAGADGRPASAWQAGLGAEWAPTDALALSAGAYGRTERDILRAGPSGVTADAGRAAGVDVAGRFERGGWTVSLAGAAAAVRVRSPGAAWRAAPFSRPFTGGLLVERALGPLSLGLRLDALAGRPDGSGPSAGRTPADVRTGLAVGVGTTRRGVRFEGLVQAQIRLAGTSGGALPDVPLPLARDGRALPAFPTLSLAARW